jgi:hypothetical protein
MEGRTWFAKILRTADCQPLHLLDSGWGQPKPFRLCERE